MRSQTKSGALIGSIAALAAGASYGLGGTICQIIEAGGFATSHIVAAEYLMSLVAFAALTVLCRKRLPRGKAALGLVLTGMLLAAASITYFMAIDRLSVSRAVAIQFQYVWIAVIFEHLFSRRRPGVRTVVASLAVVAGAVLGSGFADEIVAGSLAGIDPVGIMLGLACAAFQAGYLFLNGHVAKGENPLPRTTLIAAGGALLALIVCPEFLTSPAEVAALAPGGAALGASMCLAPCILFALAGRYVSGDTVAMLSASELPCAVLTGFLVLGEPVTPLMALGVVVICAGAVFSGEKSGECEQDAQRVSDVCCADSVE